MSSPPKAKKSVSMNRGRVVLQTMTFNNFVDMRPRNSSQQSRSTPHPVHCIKQDRHLKDSYFSNAFNRTDFRYVPRRQETDMMPFLRLTHFKGKEMLEYFKSRQSLPKQVSIKQALRNREWSLKARGNLSSELSVMINKSNGVVINAQPECVYRYFLGPGNNSQVVKRCFNSRWWWTPTDNELQSNLLWSQLIHKSYARSIPLAGSKPGIIDEKATKPIECSVFYEGRTGTGKKVDISVLGYELISNSESYRAFTDKKVYMSKYIRCHNKLEFNHHLADKKHLYKNMKGYYTALSLDVFEHLPLTFHIEGELTEEFLDIHCSLKRPVWIVKPGENSNRGNGIFITDKIDTIKKDDAHTLIIQQYISTPLLINRRKFDIRCFALLTSINGVFQAYFYQEGYLRTSSKEYHSKNFDDKLVHLTNDAIQKKGEDYGKYEHGNKLSFTDFQRYLDSKQIKLNFASEMLPKFKELVKDTVKATYLKLDKMLRAHSFEILGYDFLVDGKLKPWLIEVNTNPCLDISSPILARIIPSMLENAFKIAVDPLFPEPPSSPKRPTTSAVSDSFQPNKFELIFHDAREGDELCNYLEDKGTLDMISEDFN